MKQVLFYILMVPVLTVMAVSCGKASLDVGEGSLTLKAEVDTTGTRAGGSEEDLLSTARIDIYYADFSGLVRSYAYSEMPESVWMPAENYRVDFLAGEETAENPVPASWDKIGYKGTANVRIMAGKNTSVMLKARISDAVTNVSFARSMTSHFKPGYSLTIGIDGNNLVYDAGRSGNKGYFLLTGTVEPSFNWTFEGTTINGEPFVRSGVISGIKSGMMYMITVGYDLNVGDLSFNLSVDPSITQRTSLIVFEPASSGLTPTPGYEIWARHTTLYADVDESIYRDPSAVEFEYGTGEGWTKVPAERVSAGQYAAVLNGLTPSQTYNYRLMIAGVQVGNAMTITTAGAPGIPNGSFEETSRSASGKYTEFYAAGSSPWWGSGNGSTGNSGSADFGGFIICQPDTGEKVDGSQSACLVSRWALVKFAAGNLFSGYFGGLVGTKGGKVYFGRPFTGRPSALKVYVKYSAGKIDHVDGKPAGVTITEGKTYDTGRIQIALGNWDYRSYGGTQECPILVNTTEPSSFVDYSTDRSTVAFGDLQLQSDASDRYNSWAEYTIPINYRNTASMPSYIVISCAASMYGDYFTGCSSSRMWVDKMELIYE